MNLFRTIADVDMNSVMNNGMSFGERLMDGGKMILIVMAWVFAVIFLIWLMQTLFTLGVTKATSQKTKTTAEIQTVQTVEEPDNTEDDSEVTVAVITAAITAYLQSKSEDGTVPAFRVVSFKRKRSGKPWNSQN